MRPQLLNQSVAATRVWCAIALSLSALAIALAAHRVLMRPSVVAPSAAISDGVSRPAPPSPSPLPEPPTRLSDEELTQLVEARDPAQLERLFTIAQQGHPGTSGAAYEAIGHFGGERAFLFLSQHLNSAPAADVVSVARALATIGGPQAHAILQAATRSRSIPVRDAAFAALADVDTPDVRDFMLGALNDAEPTSAISYFLDCRDPRALPALERLARSPAQELSGMALNALLAQGASAEGAVTRLLQGDIELMDALLANPPHTAAALRAVRKAAIARLREGAITSGPVFDFLERDLSAESRDTLLFAARDPASADAACSALARKGDPASLQGLSELARDSDPELAAHASCALASDPDSRSLVPLQRAMRGDDQSVPARALVHINAPGARAI